MKSTLAKYAGRNRDRLHALTQPGASPTINLAQASKDRAAPIGEIA